MKYAALICLLFLTSGCDLFRTRDPQTPDQARSNYQQAVTPDLLIQNLTNSMLDKNLQNYLDCFADSRFTTKSYNFIPSSSAASQYPAFSSTFDKKAESQFFTNLIGKIPADQQMTVVFSNEISNPLGDSVIYSASYSLNIPFTDPTVPATYQGDLKFYMVLDSRNIWSIYQWQDIKTSNDLSWSDLKGRLY
jgi:hypothetical protein